MPMGMPQSSKVLEVSLFSGCTTVWPNCSRATSAWCVRMNCMNLAVHAQYHKRWACLKAMDGHAREDTKEAAFIFVVLVYKSYEFINVFVYVCLCGWRH